MTGLLILINKAIKMVDVSDKQITKELLSLIQALL